MEANAEPRLTEGQREYRGNWQKTQRQQAPENPQ